MYFRIQWNHLIYNLCGLFIEFCHFASWLWCAIFVEFIEATATTTTFVETAFVEASFIEAAATTTFIESTSSTALETSFALSLWALIWNVTLNKKRETKLYLASDQFSEFFLSAIHPFLKNDWSLEFFIAHPKIDSSQKVLYKK